MTEDFQVNEYWLRRGRTYFQEKRLVQPYHRRQEEFLLATLKESNIPMSQVLELGCGYGRITRLLAEQFSQSHIVALDLSPEQLIRAREYCADRGNIEFHPYDFYSGQVFPGGPFSVALAIEVFLHHPPKLIRDLMVRLSQVAQFIVHIDWSEAWPWPVPEHVWLHDYPALYRERGWDCVQFPLPEKADGQQQVLFVAAPRMPAKLAQMAAQVGHPTPSGAQAARSAPTTAKPDWSDRVQAALEALERAVPTGSQVILVDGAEWGMPRSWRQRRIIPFLERTGQYWGPPPNDAVAWEELQRLRLAGATHLAIGWNAFWWRECYQEWYGRLLRQCSCLLESDLLVVFQLDA